MMLCHYTQEISNCVDCSNGPPDPHRMTHFHIFHIKKSIAFSVCKIAAHQSPTVLQGV